MPHEQFPAPELTELGGAAVEAGFGALWTSDHFHPWQDNQGHACLGSAVRYTAEVDGHRWLIQTPDPAGSGLHAGEVHIHVPPERVHVIPGR